MTSTPPAVAPDDAPPSPDPKPSRRRWWRFSLRRAMILIVLVAGPIGWEANRVHRMRQAVATLERPMPGEPVDPNPKRRRSIRMVPPVTDPAPQRRVLVYHDDMQRKGMFWFPSSTSRVPRWLHRLVGPDHFRQATAVVWQRRPTPEDWTALGSLRSVKILDLSHPTVVDGDLPRWADHVELEELDLSATKISDSSLVGIEHLTHLRTLNLSQTNITDAALGPIGRMRSLQRLDLAGTATTDQGLAALGNATQFEELTLGNASGGDAGLAHLQRLTRLRLLKTGGIQQDVSDAGLAHLAGMVDLESLSFATSSVTEVGLARLATFPKLRTLEIDPHHNPIDIRRLFAPKEAKPAERPFWLTTAGAEQLGKLAHLESLNLFLLPGNDDCLRAIGRLTQLTELQVGGDAITDAGVAELAHLTRLKNLTLLAPQLTDHGLQPLSKLNQLEFLAFMTSPAITDAGLNALRPLSKLEVLSLSGQVTPEGIEQFQAGRPKRIMIHNFPNISRGIRPPPPL